MAISTENGTAKPILILYKIVCVHFVLMLLEMT